MRRSILCATVCANPQHLLTKLHQEFRLLTNSYCSLVRPSTDQQSFGDEPPSDAGCSTGARNATSLCLFGNLAHWCASYQREWQFTAPPSRISGRAVVITGG